MLWSACSVARSAQPLEFDAEAARLLRRVRLPPERLAAVPTLVRHLQRTMNANWPGSQAFLFGSISTGLGLIHSDVDVTVLLPNFTAANSRDLVTETSIVMEQHPRMFQVIRVIRNTRIPIVTAKHVPTGSYVDVSFNNLNGVMISKLLRYLLTLDKRVMDLALIVKHWAWLHGITANRLLPKYGIITMVIFFLQQKEILPPVSFLQKNAQSNLINHWNMGFTEEKYWTNNNESLCTLLGDFFKYYANFDFNKYLISTFAGRPIEIDLFKDITTVPEEFDLYKTNVGLNLTNPLILKVPIVQDNFDHASNLALRVDISPNSIFVKPFRYAATKFQENCTGFLDAILTVRPS